MAEEMDPIYVDPSGQLKLSLRHEDPRTKITTMSKFVVSPHAMCLASPVWKASLDTEGPWARQRSTDKGLQIFDDDPEALLILLNIAHLQFLRVPTSLSFDQLFHVAVICDKYDIAELVLPWLKIWFACA